LSRGGVNPSWRVIGYGGVVLPGEEESTVRVRKEEPKRPIWRPKKGRKKSDGAKATRTKPKPIC